MKDKCHFKWICLICLLQCLIVCENIISQIPFCETAHILTTQDSQAFNARTICIECKKLKVLSSDFSECIDVRQELGQINLGNCKRLNEDGYCSEALIGIEIYNKQYSYTEDVMFNERCAQIEIGYRRCVYPRFGYTLDIQTNQLHYDYTYFHTYCAKYDSLSQNCIEYFPGFLPDVHSSGLGRYLFHFINKAQINYQLSTASSISCNSGYFFLGTILHPIGCIPYTKRIQHKMGIKNCQEHAYDYILCKKCKSGYAVQKNRLSCKNLHVDKCLEYQLIQGQAICYRCEEFHRYLNGKCQAMIHCKQVSEHDPKYCIACSSPYHLQFETNECALSREEETVDEQCEIFSTSRDCQLCKQNDIYFSERNHCQLRINSLSCKHPHPLRDSCSSLECIDGKYLIDIHNQSHAIDLSLPHLSDIIEEKLHKMKDNLKDEFTISCQERSVFPIQGCLNYHTFIDSCQECQTRYYLINNAHTDSIDTTARLYHYNRYQYTCSQTNPEYQQIQIDHCLQYSPDNQSCLSCQSGYVQSQTRCIKGIQNCQIHYDETTCWKCQDGYIHFGFLNQKNVTIDNHCRKNENLIGLIPHYYQQKQQIQQNEQIEQNKTSDEQRVVIEFSQIQCLHYSKDNFCTQCVYGYFLTQDYQCIRDDSNPDCKQAKLIKSSHYECLECNKASTLTFGRCIKTMAYSCIEKSCPKKCNSIFKIKQKTNGGSTGAIITNTNNGKNNNSNTNSSIGQNNGKNNLKPKTTTFDANYDKNMNQGVKNNNNNNDLICEVNIKDNFYISERPKYNKSLFGQLEIKKCSQNNCLRCEIDGCLKCEDKYALNQFKQCNKICEGQATDDQFCVKVDPKYSDDEDTDEFDEIIIEDQEDIKLKQQLEKSGINGLENGNNKKQYQNDSIQYAIILMSIILVILLVYRFIRRNKVMTTNQNHIQFNQLDQANRIDNSYV